MKERFKKDKENLVQTLKEDEEFAKDMTKQLGIAHENVAHLRRLVGDRSMTTFGLINESAELLEMMEQLTTQDQIKCDLTVQ